MRLRIYLPILLVATALLVFCAPEAGAQSPLRFILTGEAARNLIRGEGGHPHECKRLGPRRLRCNATFWYERHEAEEEEDGSLVNEVVTPVSEERWVVVGLSAT